MAELLVELLSEEIPARMQARAAEALKAGLTAKLDEAQLAFTSAAAYATPRRLALAVDGLPERQPDSRTERRGPRAGAPAQAVRGFIKSLGVPAGEVNKLSDDDIAARFARGGPDLKIVAENGQQLAISFAMTGAGKAQYHAAMVLGAGRPAAVVLPSLLNAAIAGIPWPKSMRWADSTARYVRPLQSVLAIFDGRPLVGGYPVGGATGALTYSNRTRGHRFLAPDAMIVTGFADYQAKLRAAHVVLDPAERQRTIADEVARLAAAEGLTVRDDPGLLDEVVGLVEWPVVMLGRIDPRFMEVPPEVLITTMRNNQKYFALLDGDGALAPRFALVANMAADDGGATIRAGNERVLSARLSDAKFFWDQDRRARLADRLPDLDPIVFHARLGSMGAKARRVAALAGALAAHVPGADGDAARQAGLLCKADLTSGMVGEFPELQGVMGRYYARGEGQPEAVAEAIGDHYAPQGPNDRCPTAPVSVAVALADKLDNLVGFFAIDEKPTGSRDPFALRRAALGVIRLILENRLRLPLRALVAAAHGGYGETVSGPPAGRAPDRVAADLLDFFADRLKVHLREQGVRHDLIAAVFALGDEDDLVRLLARVHALDTFVTSDDGANLLTAFRRASNIVGIEEKRDGTRYDAAPESILLQAAEERSLHGGLIEANRSSARALAAEDFAGAMSALARLRQPVDAFFDKVTVNCDDSRLRANRLRLLSQIRATMAGVADFSQLEG